jgi:NAD-dependent DNA ligase
MTYLDDNGQPDPSLNRGRRYARSIDEILGFLRGVTADDVITTPEVLRLTEWVDINREFVSEWPVNVLYQRLTRILADDVVTEEERTDLKVIVDQILGSDHEQPFERASSSLPLCSPVPEIIFDRNVFVLTGKFLYGTRRSCEEEVQVRGGTCADNVTLGTSYLVIGEIASRDWRHTTHGRKIQKAVDYKEHCSIAIVSEQHWASYLMPERATGASK